MSRKTLLQVELLLNRNGIGDYAIENWDDHIFVRHDDMKDTKEIRDLVAQQGAVSDKGVAFYE